MLDIKGDLQAFLAGVEDPVKIKTVLKGLGLNNHDKQYIRALLQDMVREGKVIKTGTRYWLVDGQQQAKQIKREKTEQKTQRRGRLSVTSRGFGFVALDSHRTGGKTGTSGKKPGHQDWLIPETELNGAKNGDWVRVSKIRRDRDGRVVAKIIGIEAFGIEVITGVFTIENGRPSFIPFCDFKIRREEMRDFPEKVAEGAVGKWSRTSENAWTFTGIIGDLEDPVVDESIVLSENQIPSSFPDEVLAETKAFEQFDDFQVDGRQDFRNELVFTVDGPDARDFDDALHVKQIENGLFEVGIHIADVSHFVTEDSETDLWARALGNSVYLPHKAFPMLPRILSNGLCSLNPGEPRYTLSVLVNIDKSGAIDGFRFSKGLICSAHRLTYEQVQRMGIDKDETLRALDPELTRSVDWLLNLAAKLRIRRFDQGGLELNIAASKITLNKKMELEDSIVVRQNEANHMIEAFMCLVNECVAETMSREGIGTPYRIHDQPDVDKLKTFANFLEASGLEVPERLLDAPASSLNQIGEALRSIPRGEVMQTQLLKSLKQAEYSPENRGHFGLGSKAYAHFTSPIRRYADLVVHRRMSRLLKERQIGPEHFDDTGLDELCGALSARERNAARAEYAFVNLKLLRAMRDKVGLEFEGVITEVKSFGFFVQLDPLKANGLVRLEELRDDYYEFHPEMLALVGKRKSKVLRVGLSVRVQVLAVNLVTRRIDLALVDAMTPAPRTKSFKSKQRSRKKGGVNKPARTLKAARKRRKRRG